MKAPKIIANKMNSINIIKKLFPKFPPHEATPQDVPQLDTIFTPP
jgi:hypothetical protein